MTLLNQVPNLIKPYNFYLQTEDSKEYFLNRFDKDLQSFDFLNSLIKYSCAKNQGEWPEIITFKILEKISPYLSKKEISIEDTKIYKEGYILKSEEGYKLTHEFIVYSYICCGDGNFLPLSSGHIDFSNEEKILKFLENEMFIKEPQALKFLMILLKEISKHNRVLMSYSLKVSDLLKISIENDLVFELCLDWAQKHNLVAVYRDDVICNGLIFSAYAVSPKLR